MSWKWKGEPGQGYSDLYKALVPLPVRRWGGYGPWLVGRYGASAWRSRGYRLVSYTMNLARDVEARLMGFCNHAPWPVQGGYSHWRCARRRRECEAVGYHRCNNYTWVRGSRDRVAYDPLPVTMNPIDVLIAAKSRPYRSRRLQPTIRQSLAQRRKIRDYVREQSH